MPKLRDLHYRNAIMTALEAYYTHIQYIYLLFLSTAPAGEKQMHKGPSPFHLALGPLYLAAAATAEAELFFALWRQVTPRRHTVETPRELPCPDTLIYISPKSTKQQLGSEEKPTPHPVHLPHLLHITHPLQITRKTKLPTIV